MVPNMLEIEEGPAMLREEGPTMLCGIQHARDRGGTRHAVQGGTHPMQWGEFAHAQPLPQRHLTKLCNETERHNFVGDPQNGSEHEAHLWLPID